MFKRTKGYILLTLLVVTGLAGRMSTNTISSRERHFLILQIKESRSDFLNSVEDLSDKQWNFKPHHNGPSIKEYVQKMLQEQNNLWLLTNAVLLQKANPYKRKEIKLKDEDLIKMPSYQNACSLFPKQTEDEMLDAFKENQNNLIKYVKTTTEDLRNHVTSTSYGAADACQMLLILSAYTRFYTRQIEEVKANPAFPK
jgi:hypothetical protein